MRRITGRLAMVALMMGAAGSWAAAQAPGTAPPGAADTHKPAATSSAMDPRCPVSNDPIDLKVYEYYRGRRVYLCCGGCISMFKRDPEKYLEPTKRQWEALRPLTVQVACPGCEKPIDSRVFVEGELERVYFCSAGCQHRWEKEQDALAKRLNERCVTFQTTCPCGAQEIDPAVSAEIAGRRVYFCCPGCEKGYRDHLAEMSRALDRQIEANRKALPERAALIQRLKSGP